MAENGPAPEHVIVVDDDPVIRAILRSTLAGIGLGVHCASHGAAALEIAGRMRADLFLLDLLMPRMSGLDACRALRGMVAHADTPIVMLTGRNDEAAQNAAFAAGVDMFLAKPFRPAALLAALEPILQGGSVAHPASAQAMAASWNELRTQPDPEYCNHLWGRQDAQRTAALLARDVKLLGRE